MNARFSYEFDRAIRLDAELQVDALLARCTQPEPANFCADEDDVPPAVTARQLLPIVAAWLACMLGALWLCTDEGGRFLATIWGLA